MMGADEHPIEYWTESALALDDPGVPLDHLPLADSGVALNRIEARIESPGPIPTAVQSYFDAKDLRPEFDWDAVWQEEHVAAFTAAKFVEEAVLRDLRNALSVAIEEGKPFKQFMKDLKPELQARGWWGEKTVTDPVTGRTKTIQVGAHRLKTIFDTNLRTARAAGQWERIQQAKETRPALRYVLGPSERHRPDHVALAGTILPVDDPSWSAIMPPNGFNCRCGVIQETLARANRRGGYSDHNKVVERINSARSKEADKQWRRAARRAARQGKPPPERVPPPVAERISDAVEPAFATNPGELRLAGFR